MCANACGVCVSRCLPKDVIYHNTYYTRVPHGLDPARLRPNIMCKKKTNNNNSRLIENERRLCRRRIPRGEVTD